MARLCIKFGMGDAKINLALARRTSLRPARRTACTVASQERLALSGCWPILLMMTEPQDLIEEHLQQARVMQVATVRGGRPWVCSVYFVADEQQRLYWLSWPSRRHSRDIAANDRVAVAIAVKTDKPVIGIQAEGRATVVTDSTEVQRVMQRYTEKYGEGSEFYNNFVAGKNLHELYRFTPETYVLFDELYFKDGAAVQKLSLS